MTKSSGYEFSSNIPEVKKRVTKNSKANILEAIMIWHEGVVETLTGNRSGREYRIPAGKRRYRASKPYVAPAQRTGRLRSSYQFRVVSRGLEYIGEVGSPLNYAPMLENGTKRMAPRPHVYPAYLDREKEIQEALGRDMVR